MRGVMQRAVCGLVLMALAVLGGPVLPAKAEGLDTSRLPRVAGAKESFASAATTIYISPAPVDATAAATSKALGEDGWQPYAAPDSQLSAPPNTAIMSFKKGPRGLTVFITPAPAQANATSVSYTAVPLSNDLPFPKDARATEFDPHRPLLRALTAASVEDTLAYYRHTLGAAGWLLWSARTGTTQPQGGTNGEMTGKGAYAYYRRADDKALALTLLREGSDTRVEIKGVPVQALAAAHQAELERNKPRTVEKSAATAAQPAVRAAGDSIDGMLRQMQQMAREATADALSGNAPAPAQQLTAADGQLQLQAGSKPPIPLPDTASQIEYDGQQGSLAFESTSPVSAIADFYRSQMAPLGWQERRTPMDLGHMKVLEFHKAGKRLRLTIMRAGDSAAVHGDGTALLAAAKPETEATLEAEDKNGWPVPKSHTGTEGTRTPFRRELKATVPAELADVLSFYRRELAARGWKEEPAEAVIEAERAIVRFVSPDGAALMTLDRKDGTTTISITARNSEAARKAGVLPTAGQAKLLFGNLTESEAVVTVHKKKISIGAGVGAKDPDGPTIDLPPGKYKLTVQLGGKPAPSEDIEVAGDETWGVIIGPGGALPLHIY